MRSGAFSMVEPRSSTKGVLTGAGRARRCKIHALSTVSGCALDGGALDGCVVAGRATAGSAAASSAASSIARRGLAATGVVRRGVLPASAVFMLAPEIIEVEPVERRIAHMMFEAGGITPDERRHRRGALAARDRQPVAERLEHQIVAVAAAVQAEGQLHRHL